MPKLRKIVRWSLVGLAAVLILLIAVPVLVVALGVSLSAAPWRADIAAAASRALGREVVLEGPLELVPTLQPTLRIGGIRIANPPGFSAPEFASLGGARLRLELMPLLERRIEVQEISAEDVRLRMERTADGHVNWKFALPPSADDHDAQGPSAAQGIRLRSVARISFKRIGLEYVNAGVSRQFALDELTGTGAVGQPLALTLRGSVERTFPYTVSIEGAPLVDLYAEGKPWPFDLQLEFAGTKLYASGNVKDALKNPAVDVLFGLGTPDLSELERLLQTKFPPVGATGLSGQVSWAGNQLHVSNLRGVMGESTLEGDLAFDLTGTKPRLTGALNVPVLDLRPFLSGRANAPPPEPGADTASAQEKLAELDKQSYSLKELGLMDAQLTLGVQRWIGIPGEVRDAQLRVEMQNGQLKAPIQAVVADVPLAGEIEVLTRENVPALTIRLGTVRSQLGRLAEVFARVRGVAGYLGRFELQLKGQGDHLSAIVRTLDVRLDVEQAELSYGNVEGGRPVGVKLDRFKLAIPAGDRLQGEARGSLLREAFSARFKGGDLITLTRTIQWPLELEVKTGGAALRVDGVLAPPEATEGTDLRFRLSATRAGDVASWLGLARGANTALAVDGHVRVESDEWRLNPFTLRLGRTRMNAELARTGIGGKPLVQARVVWENVDVPELQAMLPPPDPKVPRKSMFDIPILPQGIDLLDADVDVKLRRIEMQPVPVTDVSFSGHIREGKMWPSPFRASVAGATFSGAIGMDLRTEVPEAAMWVAAEQVDVGSLLQQLKLVQGLEASVGLLRAELIARGSRLGDLLAGSSLLAELETGKLVVRDPNRTIQLPIQVAKGLARVSPGQPLSVDLDGTIDATPITIRIVGAQLPDLIKTGTRVPFALTAEAAGTQLRLNGQVALPMSQRDIDLNLSVKGERFDSMNALTRVDLPKWGPWQLNGRFHVAKTGYDVPDLALRVGASTLNGHGSLNTTAARPQLAVQLSAPSIQLDDFKLTDWSLLDKKEQKDEKPLSVEEMRAKAKEAAAKGQKLLSPEVMRALDAKLDVEVAEVLSGKDQLGSGTLRAQLADGKFMLDPAQVNIPGGSARVTLTYFPTATDVSVEAKIRADRFDYGILARRIKPDTDLGGLVSLTFDLTARAPTLDQIMQHANGHIDFAVWPRNFKAGIFDLWAVNLLVALLPAVDPANESKVNCAVARFDLRDGKLTHDQILMDTSRMRVNGQGNVDFATEALAFRMVPTAKSPQFFSLATPVGVTGTITNFKVGVSGSAIAETVARLFTSVIVVPLQSLAGRKLPRDGADVCDNAMRDMRS